MSTVNMTFICIFVIDNNTTKKQALSNVDWRECKREELKKILGLYELGPLPNCCMDKHPIFSSINPFGLEIRSVPMLGAHITVDAQ